MARHGAEERVGARLERGLHLRGAALAHGGPVLGQAAWTLERDVVREGSRIGHHDPNVARLRRERGGAELERAAGVGIEAERLRRGLARRLLGVLVAGRGLAAVRAGARSRRARARRRRCAALLAGARLDARLLGALL